MSSLRLTPPDNGRDADVIDLCEAVSRAIYGMSPWELRAISEAARNIARMFDITSEIASEGVLTAVLNTGCDELVSTAESYAAAGERGLADLLRECIQFVKQYDFDPSRLHEDGVAELDEAFHRRWDKDLEASNWDSSMLRYIHAHYDEIFEAAA